MSDLISRQAAINAANDWLLDCLNVQKQDRSCGLIRRLEDLPSAEPEPSQVARDICTILENEQDMRVILKNAQPEPLTDKEQRIFLSAMYREAELCMDIYSEYEDMDRLIRICHEIIRKVKGALWT